MAVRWAVVMRGTSTPWLVERTSNADEASGAVVPMPTLFCPYDSHAANTKNKAIENDLCINVWLIDYFNKVTWPMDHFLAPCVSTHSTRQTYTSCGQGFPL